MVLKKHAVTMIVVGCAMVSSAAAASFLSPGEWTPGDTGSTYQEWDFLSASFGNTPDVGRLTDGTALPDPTNGVVPPGFSTSSGNYYFFGGPYGVVTDVPNYGSGAGTHVIVQISASANPDPNAGGPASVFIDTLQIEDDLGNVLSGGANADALQETLTGTRPGGGPLGPVTFENWIWEFYLPGYTGDIQITSTSIVHSSFDAIRVDTLITDAALPITIPEPATLILLSMTGLLLRRR